MVEYIEKNPAGVIRNILAKVRLLLVDVTKIKVNVGNISFGFVHHEEGVGKFW